jgi:hypothetical protein
VNQAGEKDAETAGALPKLDFTIFILSVVGSAHVHLGDGPEGAPERNLELARQDIDLLAILQEKTRGNLTGDEERLLDQALYDLRMRFVEVSKPA